MEKLDKLVDLYVSYAGTGPVSSEPLPVSGSNRKYFRLTGKDGKSVIGTSGESSVENRVFVETDRHLASKGVRVPEIYAVSGDFSVYLQEIIIILSPRSFLLRLLYRPYTILSTVL